MHFYSADNARDICARCTYDGTAAESATGFCDNDYFFEICFLPSYIIAYRHDIFPLFCYDKLMTILQSLLLGALQGVTEFLPVSSSGHLAVAQHLFSLGDVPLLFDVFLHLATLVAVMLYFRRSILKLFCALGRMIARRPVASGVSDENGLTKSDEASRKTVAAVIVATLVTGVIGIAAEKILPSLSIRFVFAGFIVTAFILLFSQYVSKKRRGADNGNGISWKQALVVGAAQGIGTLPGISRSGSTIAGGLLSGLDRVDAGEFSFIVSIPAILGAFILELKDFDKMSGSIGALQIVIGCAAAFVVGYASLSLLMKIIKKGKLGWFACYLVPLGIAGLLFFK